MAIIAHTMEFTSGERILCDQELRHYQDSDYSAYKNVYEDCFADMRRALGLFPVNCCDAREKLLAKAGDIFILEQQGELIGSVAIYGREIDDLIVAKQYQRKGYGQRLLRFAVARMQHLGVEHITLHVADWNQPAMRLYAQNGFTVVKTNII